MAKVKNYGGTFKQPEHAIEVGPNSAYHAEFLKHKQIPTNIPYNEFGAAPGSKETKVKPRKKND